MIKRILLVCLLSSILFADQNAYTKEQLEKMIAKMVMLGFHGEKIDSSDKIYQDIQKYDLGGVILFDKDPNDKKKIKNIKDPKQLVKLTSQLQAINKTKLLISIDQEGGIVQRLKDSKGFINTPKASIVSTKGTSYAKNTYSKLAKVLKKSGLNVNYAPVVDLNINPNNPVIAKLGRSFGKSSKEVIKYASIFTKEMKKQNIISVLKHFPGHGSSLSDSHKGFVDITKTWKKEELEPYKYFIKNGLVDMIMSAHVVNRNLDYSLPATLSWNINTKLLRKELGYKGVLISDDLQMYAISKHYSLDDTVRLAINSGIDMLMYANQLAKPLKLETIINSVYKQVRSGEIKMYRIKEANKRIDALKKKLI
ncbi:glycoside hydrolase family 3 protein [Poseidonibacter lekithochrous]|uniref:glycoside hydrolase family 3 protein n=1 Tax=Poseidonibacter TaxID=2321187 RepID=UPI001C09742B|nr:MULTISPECIES: glycoside hydrolase family 3 N-terminal domain-containing protein [Poseidonibacter]MBU3013894.1 glycoside hydrolase family 3 protein [Poseidonibacter lekithochrous]MDO6827189.1 glycoside hydrolase family 3 N-terminal domain-containing protein [Poseidonibacter sp. 1_MG-2023]